MRSIYSYALAVEEILEPLTPEQREQVILLVYQPVPDAPRAEKVASPRPERTVPKSAEARQTEILDLLRGAGGEASNAALARSLGISQQAMTKYLVALSNAGLITRTHGASRITTKGVTR